MLKPEAWYMKGNLGKGRVVRTLLICTRVCNQAFMELLSWDSLCCCPYTITCSPGDGNRHMCFLSLRLQLTEWTTKFYEPGKWLFPSTIRMTSGDLHASGWLLWGLRKTPHSNLCSLSGTNSLAWDKLIYSFGGSSDSFCSQQAPLIHRAGISRALVQHRTRSEIKPALSTQLWLKMHTARLASLKCGFSDWFHILTFLAQQPHGNKPYNSQSPTGTIENNSHTDSVKLIQP
jgi:hypothetical protein